jgi:hypothetical protein
MKNWAYCVGSFVTLSTKNAMNPKKVPCKFDWIIVVDNPLTGFGYACTRRVPNATPVASQASRTVEVILTPINKDS